MDNPSAAKERDSQCVCPLPYRGTEEHIDTCPVVCDDPEVYGYGKDKTNG